MQISIIGSTGTLGKKITRLCNEKGHQVTEVSRSSNPAIDIEDPKSIENYFNQSPSFDAIICATGHASWGKLSELTDEQIKKGINNKLLGQINVVKYGLKKLNPKGIIMLTGGLLAYSPWPETSNIAMVNAGLEGFVRAAALELDEEKRIVVVHPPLIRETARKLGLSSEKQPTAATVAKTYMKALSDKSNGGPLFVEGYITGASLK